MTEPPAGRPSTVDRALAETPEQRYIGDRDLTEWRTRAGRALAAGVVRIARRAAPHRLLLLTALVGAILVTLLGTVAAEVYDAVADSDGVASFDEPVLDFAVDSRSGPLTSAVQAFTDLGGGTGMPILATVAAVSMALAWRQWTPILLVSATAAGSLAMTWAGKAVVGRARPPLVDAVPPYEASFSFPSGHTLNSIAMAGIVAYLLVRWQRRAWARALTVVFAALFSVAMGLSRVYLGHHWLTDVLVAWALGLAWLTVVITAHRLLLTVRRQRDAATERAPPRP